MDHEGLARDFHDPDDGTPQKVPPKNFTTRMTELYSKSAPPPQKKKRAYKNPQAYRNREGQESWARCPTVDDTNPALPQKDPKLWELWYIPYYG